MLAFMLSGKDDQGIVATEKRDIVAARLRGQLGLIASLLAPLEARLQKNPSDADDTIERVETAIADLSSTLAFASEEHAALQITRQQTSDQLHRARSQIVAIDELLARYELLDDPQHRDTGGVWPGRLLLVSALGSGLGYRTPHFSGRPEQTTKGPRRVERGQRTRCCKRTWD